MSKKTKKNEKAKENRFVRVLGTKLPPALEKTCQPLFYIGAALMSAALVQVLAPSLRSLSPFAAFLGLILLVFAYMKKREMVMTGYNEYVFTTLNYTFLTKHGKTPTGVLLIDTTQRPEERELYHIAVSGNDNVPPLDWKIRVYVPKNAMIAEYNGRKHFSSVYGYQVEEEA